MTRDISTADVIMAAIDSAAVQLRVAVPARVERYDASRQVVDATPLLKEAHVDEDGARRVTAYKPVLNVPVVFPGSGGFRLTFPIQRGDTVLLVFCDQSLDIWLNRGGEVDPEDPRRHHLSDAIAIPGLHPNTTPWTGASTANATIGKDGGPLVSFTPTAIELAGSNDAVALASKVDKAFATLTTLLTGVSASGPTGAAISAAFVAAQTALQWPVLTGSSTVKTRKDP